MHEQSLAIFHSIGLEKAATNIDSLQITSSPILHVTMASSKDEWACSRQREKGNYWKLRCTKHTTITQARKAMPPLYCPRDAKRDRVMNLLYRAERGLLSYGYYTKANLQVFVEDRRLQDTIPATATKSEMIAGLEKADDDATFSRFVELPPELRVRIYEYHFHTFGSVDTPAQPPVTLVSRLLREEALPLFYEIGRFKFTAFPRYGGVGQRTTVLNDNGRQLLKVLSGDGLSRIRKLELSFDRYVSWLVDLCLVKGVCRVQHLPVEAVYRTEFAEHEVHQVGLRIGEVAKEVVNRGGSRRLHPEDIEALIRAIRF